MKKLIGFFVALGLLAVGLFATASPASAQGCVWNQVQWVLNAHGSTQFLADSCYNNHFAGYNYPQGGGAPRLAFEAWAPAECIAGGVSIATGNNAGNPAKITFKGINNVSFCQFDWWGWGTSQAFKAGSCNGWNVRNEGWMGVPEYGTAWYNGVHYNQNFCTPQPTASLHIYGI